MAAPNTDPADLFRRYISNKKVLIADPAKTSRNALLKIICGLGAIPTNVLRAETYQEAYDYIKDAKPNMVICEYDLGKRCGLDLIQTFRAQFPETKDCIFVLMTSNSSQSTVAQAAEEDVDTFILKPYSTEVLTRILLRAAITKINPPEYLKQIEKGKALLIEKKFDEAIVVFKEAEKMDARPALAAFYTGQAELMKTLLEQAESSYKKGLSLNKIHYKCMVGLFDLLMQKKAYTEAYDLVSKMSRLFPANPKRLASVLRLAIMTKNYDDIERYYQLFTAIENRDEELIQYICSAMVVCGKYYLRSNHSNRGLELFEKAAISAAGRSKFLKEIILGLCEFKMHKEARSFLNRYPSDQQEKSEYLSMRYLIDSFDRSASETLNAGHSLLKNGHIDPILYRVYIKAMYENGQKEKIENILVDALKKFPDQKSAFDAAQVGRIF